MSGHRKGKTSAVAEHYLTIIYTTQRDGHDLRSHRLAARLKVSAPTVTETLRRLAKDGFVRTAARHIELTERGKAVAERALRRHFIVERWLTDVLGMGWAEADVEAHRLDHGLSDRVADRLFKALGQPKTCPHGNPMPGVAAPRPGRRSLRHVKAGDVVAMERITEEGEEDSQLLDLLESGGIRPGTKLTVENVSAGAVRVRAGRRALAMGLSAADYIRVKTLSGSRRRKRG